LCSFITDEILSKSVERMCFSESSTLLGKIAKSSPSCFIVEDLDLNRYLPSYCSDSKLKKLELVLPKAAETIRSYLLFMLKNTEADHHNMHKKKISFKDVLLAFASDSHINAINTKIRNMDLYEKLPWLIESQQFTVAEFLFMHTINLVEVKIEDDVLIGYHPSGIKMRGLYFEGPNQTLSKLLKDNMGLVHFSTIVSITNVKEMIKKFNLIQSNKTYQEILKVLENREIDYTNNGSEESLLNWTKNRFKKHSDRI